MKKKSGDGFPMDRIGQMLFNGCIVVLSLPSVEYEDTAPLTVGYVKKLGKSYADVVYPTPGGDGIAKNNITVRVRNPSAQLMVVDRDLFPRTPEFEDLKRAAYNSRS